MRWFGCSHSLLLLGADLDPVLWFYCISTGKLCPFVDRLIWGVNQRLASSSDEGNGHLPVGFLWCCQLFSGRAKHSEVVTARENIQLGRWNKYQEAACILPFSSLAIACWLFLEGFSVSRVWHEEGKSWPPLCWTCLFATFWSQICFKGSLGSVFWSSVGLSRSCGGVWCSSLQKLTVALGYP